MMDRDPLDRALQEWRAPEPPAEELSLEEIAAVTGAEVGAVKARLHRARESVRRRLGPLVSGAAERSCK